MFDSKDSVKKQYICEPFFNNEDEKLIKEKNKINNMIQCEAPLLEKKIKIEENDLVDDFRPLPKKQKCQLNSLIILGLTITLLTLVALAATAIMITRNDDVMCATTKVEGNELFSDDIVLPVPQDDSEPRFIGPTLPEQPIHRQFNPNIIEMKKSKTTTSTTTTTQKPAPSITRNNEKDCKDGMHSFSIFPDVDICASHKEVNTDDVAWAVEDCMDIKGHLPKTSDTDELNYLGGLVKELTRMNHPSPILVKREAKLEDYDTEDSSDGVSIIRQKWVLYQPDNGSLQMDSTTTNQVGVLCIKPFDQEDAGFFSRIEESMIEMMKNMRERFSNIFSQSPFFRHQ